MILRGKAAYTPARLPVLRWLTAGGANVPPHIRDLLLSEIFTSQSAVIMGILNGLIFNAVAQYLTGGFVFVCFFILEVGLAISRLWVVRKIAAASVTGKSTPTDMYLLTAIFWCALQGAMAFAAMRTGNIVLQVLSASTTIGLIGPICARNYPAPRYAMLLVCVCEFPLVVGELMTGNRWMLVTLLQTPGLIVGCISVIRRLHRMALALLVAEHFSQQRAERDPLTGLLNRAGLEDVLLGLEAAGTRFVLFYLDLDGFKAVNDTLGHPVGDALLKAVALQLLSSIRTFDSVARLGGDEFVIVVPNMLPAAGSDMAASVIRRITDQEYLIGPECVAHIGISVGYACWPDDGPTLDLLRNHADAALYEAKRAGKGLQRRFAGGEPICADENLGRGAALISAPITTA